MTPLPSISWVDFYSDGSSRSKDECHWNLCFDVGDKHVDIQMYANGMCEWFASDHKTHDYCGNEGDTVPFSQVCIDPKFGAAMQSIKDAYDKSKESK